jgi:hypothetical protein
MENVIEVKVDKRPRGDGDWIYPVNRNGRLLLRLIGHNRKTLSLAELSIIKELGYEIVIKPQALSL